MEIRIIKLTEQEEAALMVVFQAALSTQDFNIATNVVLLREKILKSEKQSE